MNLSMNKITNPNMLADQYLLIFTFITTLLVCNRCCTSLLYAIFSAPEKNKLDVDELLE